MRKQMSLELEQSSSHLSWMPQAIFPAHQKLDTEPPCLLWVEALCPNLDQPLRGQNEGIRSTSH